MIIKLVKNPIAKPIQIPLTYDDNASLPLIMLGNIHAVIKNNQPNMLKIVW